MKKLLIAEHVSAFSEILTDVLRQDWDISICTDGNSTIDALQALQPDALIIDLGLPRNDGLSVLAESFPRLPPAIVALSSVVNPCVKQSAARWGVDYLFELPFDPGKVKAALDEAALQQIPAKRTAQHLRTLGFRSGLDGYICLIAAVPYLLEDPARKLGLEVYTHVAKVCGLTDYRDVERAIRFAIKDAWKRRDLKAWADYFPLNENGDISRPKSKDFIRLLMLLVK